MPAQPSNIQQLIEALGMRLRELRVDAGLTGRALGRLTGWHSSKVSKIEHARQIPSVGDIRTWCQCCGAAEQADELVASLRAAEGLFVDWRRMERTGLRVAQESVVPLWERTRRYRIYSSWIVPGPLQTQAYIAAALSSIMVRRDLPDDIEAAVQVRVDKQHVVHEGDRRFACLLEESVLHTLLGGADVMAGQLGHLLAVGALPSISLGVIPQGVDRFACWPTESFSMFDDTEVAVELVSGHLTISQPREVAMYADTFARLASLAVYGAAARALIASAITALDGSRKPEQPC